MTTRQTLDLLRDYESRNVTFIEPDGSWPIVWDRAKGVHVWDADGKKYLDLTAAFGVAAAGHTNPRVVRAGQRQMARLLHAMGDVHPHALKAQLARELSRITFERWQGNSDGRRSGKGAQPSGCRGLESTPGTPKSNRLPSIPSSCSLKAALLSGGLDPALQAGTDPARPASEASGAGIAGLRGKTIFCNSGFEAVEAALKTAMLATRKPGVIAFEGAYHGLGYGALNVTQRAHFRSPFRRQLREFACFVPFPQAGQAPRVVGQASRLSHLEQLARQKTGGTPAPLPEATASLKSLELSIRRLFRRERIGAVLVEPIQVRGGMRIPPPGFLPMLRRLCDEHHALLVLDEIYTGFGRTGRWFACEQSATVPDLVCLGKALTGGFPLSACVGRADLMDSAWPPSSGEAIHTSTFLGHPVGCAMALAQIREIESRALVRRSAELGKLLLSSLAALAPCLSGLHLAPRGLGLLAGLEVRLPDSSPATAVVIDIVKTLLRRGFILLPEGEHSNVIGFTPPLTISALQLRAAVNALGQELQRCKVT